MQSEAEAMLLDRYLPQYDVTETHAVIIDADTDLTWQAVRRSDLSRSAVIRVLLELRSLPNRLQRVLTRQPPGPARPPLTLDDMERAGFLLPGEWPGHEIVFGTVVQPWKAVIDDEPETADHCPHRTPAPNAGLSGGGGHAERGTATRAPSPGIGHDAP